MNAPTHHQIQLSQVLQNPHAYQLFRAIDSQHLLAVFLGLAKPTVNSEHPHTNLAWAGEWLLGELVREAEKIAGVRHDT